MQLRILTYNIHKCIGGVDRRYDPQRVAEVIAHYQPDIALLQEVDDHAKRSKRHRQVDLLGDLLGMRHRTWFANVKVRGGGSYGNAILSRHPWTETSNIDLTVPMKKRRSVLHARYRVRLHGKNGHRKTRTLHIFNTHLGLAGYERKQQLKRLLSSDSLTRLHKDTPVIVAGDLNDLWGSLGAQHLVPAGFSAATGKRRTFPAWAPLRPLDGIFVRGKVDILKIQRGTIAAAKQASDHLPLVGDLRIR